jgi:ATP-dependent Clp protease ATP-binding subunit ClpA
MVAQQVPDTLHSMNASVPDYVSTAERIRGLESHLSSRIKGQDHAISRVCSLLERGQFGLNPIDKPLGSFLFLGPTGVGKTQLTLEFAHLPV